MTTVEILLKITQTDDGYLMPPEIVKKIIRCRDCKYYDSFSQECRNGLDGIFLADWFCADGERKDESISDQ